MLYIPDYVVVGSDSGRIVILEYIAQKNIFEKVCFEENFYQKDMSIFGYS